MRDATDIVVLLDRSGSMSTIRTDMIGGFDAYIAELLKQPGECAVTLHQFDTAFDTVYENRALAQVPSLVLEPRGGTALLDAMDRAIDLTGARLAALPEDKRPKRVLFVVITDGGENSSHRVKREALAAKVKQQREVYSWDFIYLGANQDSFAEAGAMGVNLANVGNFAATPAGVRSAYQAAAVSTNSYRSGGDASVVDPGATP